MEVKLYLQSELLRYSLQCFPAMCCLLDKTKVKNNMVYKLDIRCYGLEKTCEVQTEISVRYDAEH